MNEDVAEDSLHAWLQKQRELQRNIRRVCEQYGDKVKVEVDTEWLIYEPKHKLLFCRNNKVIIVPPADHVTNACPQVGTTSWLADFLLMSDSRSLLERGRISGTRIHEIVKETFRVPNMTPQKLR